MYLIETDKHIELEVFREIHYGKIPLRLSDAARKKIAKCRTFLDEKVAASDAPIYGINTGFGSLYNVSISERKLEQLQKNIVMSHACGMGDEAPFEIVRLMLLLKIQGLAFGHSGVQVETVQRLIDFWNHGITPVVYTQGSLGASGDLAPLAHLSLPLLGLGEVYYNGQKMGAVQALSTCGLAPVHLQSKEGLALLNGTQFMSAYMLWSVWRSQDLAVAADAIGTLSLEAFDGRPEPFDKSLHAIRPHEGQIQVAAHIRTLLEGSELIVQEKKHVQDPYAFRCMPQVHGASRDTIAFAAKTIQTEIGSVTDNPTAFPDEDLLLSGGNFHGQPLALALDFLAIAIHEFSSISERRTYQLISGLRGLPAFLVADPGLNSGFMIPQYTASSIVSRNKQHCTPASIDSIVSSNGQEDHVSMGANAAVKCREVIINTQRVLAIELMNASQAMEFRRPLKTSPKLEKLVTEFRKSVSFVDKDRMLYRDMESALQFVQNFDFSKL
ncbi:MAG: histidine ammonia-lyase [Bacteroidia bacterium]